MVFSSILFLCLYLPLVLILNEICPKRFRNALLLVVSLLFYGFGEPRYIWILIFSAVFDYGNGLLIARFQGEGQALWKSRIVLLISVIGNLSILGFFKYSGLVPLPIGVSFYTFQTMSYTIDVYRGKVKPQKNLISFGAYVALFPQLIAGPIVRYSDVEKELNNRVITAKHRNCGMERFLIGLGKKVLLANQIGLLWEEINGLSGSDFSMLIAWLGLFAYSFQIYFDFSGYSDMAIGIGQMLGFHFPENFDYPYIAKSITDFWHRWHMTLSSWFAEYVYIPLGGNRLGLKRQILNLLIVWSLTGIWHGAGWNFLFWGIYYFVFLMFEKLATSLFKNQKQNVQKSYSKAALITKQLLSRSYTLLVVGFGWMIFAIEDTKRLFIYLKTLVGFGNVDTGSQLAIYRWKSHGLLLAILIVAATPVPKKVAQMVLAAMPKQWMRKLCKMAFGLVILVWSLAFLISGSYNPFLYFRF